MNKPNTQVASSETVKPWSRIKGLRVHHLDAKPNTISHFFERGEVPDNYLWAYRHIIDHDCGSLSCGKTVFEVVYNDFMSNDPPFFVQSGHVRGEKRQYWVQDKRVHFLQQKALTEPTTSKKTAERQCERLNKQESQKHL